MTGKWLRDFVNLLIYGGAFIGLCASCITALTFELNGWAEENLRYILFIGTATAFLYCLHRVIGMKKLDTDVAEFNVQLKVSGRYSIIRHYKKHIWLYAILWLLVTIWLFIPLASLEFVLWLLPGVIIGAAYVVPLGSKGKRLRDLGWTKILMIGWSWGWLTAFIPLRYFAESSIQIAIIHGLERMLFIVLITIPFEIRDMSVDRFEGLTTLPERFGKKKTMRIALSLCILIVFLSGMASFQYYNLSYVIAMSLVSLVTLPVIHYSYGVHDDYYFGGLTDGLMILALCLYEAIDFFV